jgi:dipeptidyl-peptidase-4
MIADLPLRKILIAAFVVSSIAAQAQTKQLTTAQMLKNEPNKVVAPLPMITGWADDTHYIKSSFGSGRRSGGGGSTRMAVDVNTGAETPYTPPVAEMSVTMRDKDVYFTKTGNPEKRLTKTADEEQNPTLSPDGTKVAFTKKRQPVHCGCSQRKGIAANYRWL